MTCGKKNIPEYDLNHDHMPADANVRLNDPSSWFDYFWPRDHIEYYVSESNKYIALKNKGRKSQIKPTNVAEFKKFMGALMYMSTYKLSNPRRYWEEKVRMITDHFTVNRFEELRSSIHFNTDVGLASSREESAQKVQPLIDNVNERLHTLKPSKVLCVDEMMVN